MKYKTLYCSNLVSGIKETFDIVRTEEFEGNIKIIFDYGEIRNSFIIVPKNVFETTNQYVMDKELFIWR